jgi:hypothetical protein
MRLHEFVTLNEEGSTCATVAGSIAPVAMPLGGMITRNGGSFFTGKYSNSADPYPNTPAYMKKGKKRRVS